MSGLPPMVMSYMVPPPQQSDWGKDWAKPAAPSVGADSITFFGPQFPDPRVDALMERICVLENELAALKAKKAKKRKAKK